jgi:predicted DsbA family dithiol-disulfide isomerase
VKVEIWSDVVCPWCYIGKRRFEAALARFPHAAEVDVEWKSFELDPGAPPTHELRGTHAEQLQAKFGRSGAEIDAMLERVTATAAGEGLDFRFDLNRGGNSFDAHRLLHLAKARGRQDALKERLDRGTFTEGLAVSDHDELTALAVETGLAEADVRDVLGSDRYADAVRADEAKARALGINGVPFFVLDGRYGVSGAQPAELFLQGLTQAWEERPRLAPLASPGGDSGAAGSAGAACEGDACAI